MVDVHLFELPLDRFQALLVDRLAVGHADDGDEVLRQTPALGRLQLLVDQHLVEEPAGGLVRIGDGADRVRRRRAELAVSREPVAGDPARLLALLPLLASLLRAGLVLTGALAGPPARPLPHELVP